MLSLSFLLTLYFQLGCFFQWFLRDLPLGILIAAVFLVNYIYNAEYKQRVQHH